MQKSPENRLDQQFCQEIIRAFNSICETLGPNSEGAVITRGQDSKFFCTGLDLEECERNPNANADGFYPLLHTILDFPLPTIALVTGHTFGAGCPLAFAHDYRIMNSRRGFMCMPPVDLGCISRGGKEALQDGLVDAIAEPEDMLLVAVELARKWAPKAKAGVYGLLGSELRGEMSRSLQQISYVHSRSTFSPGISKI
ncbi:hypothetical protein EYZ11_007526 [Aspergillus tanneri]|uniref:Enoyl-CoA hydratase n=1 Tax=Aspergillus tanneri TaxID=1220188 RepID=A0A4S3JD58_9EURO|nr:hypothetical protein EYZ11_007526 [Aspergillus tanneri]